MNKHAILDEGEALLAELERRERERVVLREGQRCVHWIDTRGVEWSQWRCDRGQRPMTVKFTEAEIRTICQRSVEGFYEVFERRPNEREQKLIVAAITRMVDEPTAPSTRLQ